MIPLALHATLDGLSAVALMAGPRLLGWPRRLSEPLFLAGAGVAAYSLATRYRPEAPGLISFDEHRMLDAAQGAAFCLAAARMGGPGPARRSLAAYGLFSLAAAALTQGEAPGRTAGHRAGRPTRAGGGAHRR
ncbi:hypothetical protein [Cereibacter sediminicola]|uniref:hypothetical protein n=1 Tax=Cereibacter sediminicola TaxID=2584941 RepID=UPI0011A81CDD|nr:hypothetical protein [Cereibacter sediminicola]